MIKNAVTTAAGSSNESIAPRVPQKKIQLTPYSPSDYARVYWKAAKSSNTKLLSFDTN